MANVIKKNDVEKYEILLPFTALIGKRKKQFLCSELEKMHPCFSDEFTFDSSVQRIKRNGVRENVLVMNKYKLAEYEGKRRFSGSGFAVEGAKISFYRRFFLNAKWKFFLRLLCGAAAFSVFLLAGYLGGKPKVGVKISGAAGGVEAAETSVASESSVAAGAFVCPAEIVFFEAFSGGDGKITSFEWKTDSLNEMLLASVKGLYPETFGAASGNTVTYEGGRPVLGVTYKVRCFDVPSAVPDNSELQDFPAGVGFNTKLRETLAACGAVLQEERTRPSHIKFSCGPRCQTARLFEEVARLVKEEDRSVTFISLSQSAAETLRADISIEANWLQVRGFDLELISKNLPLFFDETKWRTDGAGAGAGRPQRVEKAEVVVGKSNVSPETRNPKARIKIGEIRKPDNTIIVFYKNEKGKMEVER